MKHTSLLLTISLFSLPLFAGAATIDFEELDASTYSVAAGGFYSQGVFFNLNYNATYASWDGISLSNAGWKYSTTSDYTNQYYLADAAADLVHAGANNYAVIYDPGAYGTSPEIDLPDDLSAPQSMDVTNTTYTWATIINGDAYNMSKPFATGDWYMLTATGYDGEGVKTGSADVYLADYRDSDASKHYALTNFTTVNLTPLGTGVKTIKFTITSSDTGKYGINTPAYFALDDLSVTGARLWETANAKTTTWYGGVYAYQKGDGWIYSYNNCTFQYVCGNEYDAWVYDEQVGWYWTSSTSYSYIYLYNIGSWAYFYQDDLTSPDKRAYYIYNSSFSTKLPNYPYATAAELAALSK